MFLFGGDGNNNNKDDKNDNKFGKTLRNKIVIFNN